ncbi:MAG: Ppx/GppA family phosphatase [Acidobacteria bacterium]|nr:Ppx/GppA family phosphatase [Acidobacteriota bacterium]
MALERTTNIAAIDAGSNAIRLVIARAESPTSYHEVKNERAALRLGHSVFAERNLDSHTMDQAVEVFRRFKSRMNQYDVQRYRAVATSAAREARNRKLLVDRIYRSSGIRLEVIDAAEEASLVRSAVLAAAGNRIPPRLIVDLGGGSLQVSSLLGGAVQESITLPLGTVRMLEHFDIRGAMTAQQVGRVREWVQTMLRRFVAVKPDHARDPAFWCGGNAEALALLAPGPKVNGIPTLNLRRLQRKLPAITRRDVPERMEAFLVRKDRADVMAIAAIVFLALGRWWNLEQAFIPGVGVKEGVLNDVLRSLYGIAPAVLQPDRALGSARRFAALLHHDERHCEKVRQLAVSLFDQLRPLHRMEPEMRIILELSTLLHDVGHVVRHEGHHKHGEYLVRNADLPGLADRQRDMVACAVRYHSQSEPNAEHKGYASLRASEQRDIRALVSLLRIADRLDSDHRQSVSHVRIRETSRGISLGIRMRRASDLILWSVQRGTELFEKEFGIKVRVERIG